MATSTFKDFHKERISSSSLRISIVNLGCVRNTVDSQNIVGRLERKGHGLVDVGQADVVIVNTCSFIEDAKKESVDAILDLLELKAKGKIKKVIVAGCLAERYGSQLVKELPGVDAFVGVQALGRKVLQEGALLTPPHYAYLKICESCFNQCSFCVIPKLKGRFVSRTMNTILDDVKRLDERGVREINIIGQDITAYGLDLYREKRLSRLLRKIAGVARGVEWIRLLYAYPAHVTDELIEVIASEPKICKYIDLPLQHVNDRILKAMDRGFTQAQTVSLIKKIRQRIPEVFLRTTFIVGFPGETETEFEELMDFIREYPFERVGVFTYSREEGARAFGLKPQIPIKVKQMRLDRLMKAQQEILRRFQEKLIGRTIKVMIEGREKDSKDIYLGRSEYDAPDVDGVVYVKSSRLLRQGEFANVRVTGAMEYDLEGGAI